MKTPSLIVLLALLLFSDCIAQTLAGATTTDPVAHFRSVYEMTRVRKICRLEVDLNNDGKKEMLVGHIDEDPDSHERTDENDVGWWIYVGKENGQYTLAGSKSEDGIVTDGAASFSKNQYWVGLIPELNRYGLLYLSSGRGGLAKCQLKAIVIDGEAFQEIAIGQPMAAETDHDQLAKRFTNPPMPAIQEFDP